MKFCSVGSAVAIYGCAVNAIATYNPGPSYAVAIPPSTANASPGDVYFQISAATSTHQWAAIGFGTQMAGAHIFVMYSDGNGNVTISPRSGTGHVEPMVNSSVNFELVEGSGVVGDNMVANVRCSSCAQYLSSTTDANSPWIASWRAGDPIDSTDVNYDLTKHDENRQFTLDLSQAAITSDANPFTSAAAVATNNATSAAATDDSGSENESEVHKYDRIHGVLMGVAVVVLFPLGALFMPLFGGSVPHSAVIHGCLQLVALSIFISGFGVGVHLADLTDQMNNTTHTRFGIAILVLFLLQPIGGIWHHLRYKRQLVSQQRKLSRGHRWLGRTTIGLAVINGGLGLQLASGPRSGMIAWGVVSGVMALVWALVVTVKWLRNRSRKTGADTPMEKAESSE